MGVLDGQRFEPFLKALHPSKAFKESLLVFDPGETTGLAFFVGPKVVFANQVATPSPAKFWTQFDILVQHLPPDRIIYENYRVYGWKRDEHAWAELHTPKLIGAIEVLASVYGIPVVSQMAHQPKQFCNDDKLEEWGLYAPGLRHGRDAIRHGCYYLMFGQKEG